MSISGGTRLAKITVNEKPKLQFLPVRSQEESPTGQAYHWNTNAVTYYLIGEAIGQAMLGMVDLKSSK